MSSKAPINDLNEIAKRKQELRAKIEVQERRLSKDLDAYQDDIDTLKKTWNGFKSVRNFGKNLGSSNVGQVLRTVHALPIGKAAKSAGGALIPILATMLLVGGSAALYLGLLHGKIDMTLYGFIVTGVIFVIDVILYGVLRSPAAQKRWEKLGQ